MVLRRIHWYLSFVIPMCEAAGMSGHTYTHTHIHTYTQGNYSNLRCACTSRVNNTDESKARDVFVLSPFFNQVHLTLVYNTTTYTLLVCRQCYHSVQYSIITAFFKTPTISIRSIALDKQHHYVTKNFGLLSI